MEAKPICIIKYNTERLVSGRTKEKQMEDVNKLFEDRFTDYLTFAFPDYIDELFSFEVFHPKDFTVIQYQELKSMIKEAIKT